MYYPVLQRAIALVGILLYATVSFGCMTVVKPASSSEAMTADDQHGILFGGIHLTQKENDLSAGPEWPIYMKWWVQEETHGTHILLSRLPLNVPFAVKLPAGSYRITDVSLHSSQGVWHTELPKTFTVLSGECTSLGLWKLELQDELRFGWLTHEKSDEKVRAKNDMESMVEARGCHQIAAPPFDPSGKNTIRVSLYRSDQLIRP